MIDPNLLRKLGWSELLISEVLRIAECLNESNAKIFRSQFQERKSDSESCTTVFADETEIYLSTNLPYQRK